MELPFYQENWHEIQFKEVPVNQAYKEKVADAAFYGSFYETLFNSKMVLGPAWLAQKRAVSEWVEPTFLKPLRQGLGDSLRILSIGAGMGVVEEPWVQRGYRVELQECTEVPLRVFRKSHPSVPVYICDGRKIPLPDESYDLIVFSGIDYIFDHINYTALLKEINRLLKKGRLALCISFSNLSLRGIFRHFLSMLIRPFLGYKGNNSKVLWGWQRTIGGHVSHGEEVGMVADSIYIFEPKTFKLLETRRPSFLWTRPTLTTSHVAIAWRKNR